MAERLAPASRPEREAIWLEALRAAAGVARRAAASERVVLRAVAEELKRLRLRGSVGLLDEEGRLVVRSQSLSGTMERSLERLTGLSVAGYRFDPQKVDLYRQALTSRQAAFTSNRAEVVAQVMPRRLQGLLSRIMRMLGEYPVIVAPLVLNDELLGVINVTAPWLQPEDCPMVMALADHVAIALGHVRSRAEIEAALRRERLRNQVAETVASALDLSIVLDRFIRLAVEVAGADAGVIALINPEKDIVEYPYLFGLPEELALRPVRRGQGLAWRLIEADEPILLSEYGSHPHALPSWVKAGVHAFLGVPLRAGEEPVGAMGLFILDEERRFTAERVELAQAIARVAAIAVRNARLYSEAHRRAEEAQALMRTAHSVSASLDLQTVLDTIAHEAKALLEADASRIHLLDTERDVVRCVAAVDPRAEAIMSFELQPGQGLIGHVMQTGLPLLANDPDDDTYAMGLQVPGTPSDEPEVLALAPLRIRERILGGMTVRRIGRDRPFSREDLELLEAFATHAAVAIENANLYGQVEAQAQRLKGEVAERDRDLARSEARYRALVETALAGILLVDTEGCIIYANDAIGRITGWPKDDLIGKPFNSFLTPQSRNLVRERFRLRLTGERPSQEIYEIDVQGRSGERKAVLLAVSLIIDERGAPQVASALMLDISERKRLEAALQAERDRLQAILRDIGDAVMVADPQGSIEYVNPAWERLNGYALREALGRHASLIQSDKTPPGVYDELWRALEQGRAWQGEVINQRKDGSLYDAAVSFTPLEDEQGELVNVVGVLHDISRLKELDRMKSKFISDVSHELRTPLTNIRLYLDLLKSTRDRGRVQGYFDTLFRETDRLGVLIEDLLSLSRLESGATPFLPVPLDLRHMLGMLARDRRELATHRGLALGIRVAEDLPKVLGDERLLIQVFTNLLTNAMNYTPPGGSIRLGAVVHEQEGVEWVVASVEDSGLGIASEEQPLVFDRFFRGGASQVMGEPGTGLGLAICKQIIERHGGRITLCSSLGEGSTFSVWLPAYRRT